METSIRETGTRSRSLKRAIVLKEQQAMAEHRNAGRAWQFIPITFRAIGLRAIVFALGMVVLGAGLIGASRPSFAEPAGGNSTAAGPACGPNWQIVPSLNQGDGTSELYSVAVVSSTDVWAVGGNEPGQTLIERWDGLQWNIVPSPNPPTGGAGLYSVAVVSSTDVWAVGNSASQTLTEHWDGHQWSIVESPNQVTGYNELRSVAVVSSSDVWAVGYYDNGSASQTLTEHWDGHQWSIVVSPNQGTSRNRLFSVGVVSPTDVWAAGDYFDGSTVHTLTEHWDGHQWSIVVSPDPGSYDSLFSVAVVSSDDVWAVGYYFGGSGMWTLVEHWDGDQWTFVGSPNPDNGNSGFFSVAVVSSDDVWAVGGYGSALGLGFARTLVEHWDGHQWSIVESPNQGPANEFWSAAVASSTDVWAVGGYDDGSRTPPEYQTLTERYNPCPNTPTPTCEVSTTPGPWTAATPYPMPIAGYAFAEVGTDFYVIGGFTNGAGTNAVNKYDSVTGTWTPLAPIPEGGDGVVGAYYAGRIYVEVGAGLYIYDIATNTWTQGAPDPDPYTYHYGGAAGAYGGKVYVVGGYPNGVCPRGEPCGTWYTDIYDIAADSWSSGPDAPDDYLFGGYAEGGRYLYLVGSYRDVTWGGNYSATTMRLDMSGGGWSIGPTWSMARADFGLAFDPASNKLFAMGGVAYPQGVSPEVDELDVSTWPSAQWVVSPPALPSARLGNQAGFYSAGKIWSTGGQGLADHIYRDTGDGQCGTPTSTPTPVPGTATPGATFTPSATPTPCAIGFSDVHPTDYFYEAVNYLYCHGVISGYANNTFRPYSNATRGQMAKIVVLGFGIPIWTPEPSATPTFSDVDRTNAFFPYVETAAHNSIVSGYSDGTFRPGNSVTRGQLSKIIVLGAVLANGWPLINPPTPTFSDVPPGSPFYIYVETAYCHQIISGYSDGTFRPGADATRGQISKIQYLAILNTVSCAITPTAVVPRP